MSVTMTQSGQNEPTIKNKISMKNVRKLTKKKLKGITGGVAAYCPSMFQSCEEWCSWSPWQKSHCILSQPCTECFD